MRERQAQVVLLIRAFEEVDRKGVVLPAEARSAATSRSMRVTGMGDATHVSTVGDRVRLEEAVLRRAFLLRETLGRRLPEIGRIMHSARRGVGVAPAVLVLGFVIGLMTNALGPARHINLLAFPLLGLLAWNLAMSVVLGLGSLKRTVRAMRARAPAPDLEVPASSEPHSGGLVGALANYFIRGVLTRAHRSLRRVEGVTPAEARVTGEAFTRFAAMWHRLTRRLITARMRLLMHLISLSIVLGAVIGMYFRGFAFEYRATWESTLLDASQVQAFLGFVLRPAAIALGLEVPSVAELRATADGDAAVWIHLYGMTALLFAILPRSVLALIEAIRSHGLAVNLPVDLSDGYFRRVFTNWRGSTRDVEILPYSFRLNPHAVARLKTLLHDFLGARAALRVCEPLSYGDDPDCIPRSREAPRGATDHETFYVVVFNLAQPPEVEVHGTFLEQLKEEMADRPNRLIVFVDAFGFKRKVDSPERRRERLAAWERVAAEAGLPLIELDADRADGDRMLAEVREAVWPALEPVQAG